MGAIEIRPRRLAVAVVLVTLLAALGASAPVAGAMGLKIKRMWMPAPPAPETPSSFNFKGGHIGKNVNLNQVGVIKIGSSKAKNVMVFVPGTSGGAAYIVPFAKSLVERLPDWQVWSVERRENLLEDQSMISKAKRGDATPAQTFHYYLGYLTENLPAKPHMKQIPPGNVSFAKHWGMNVAVEDLHTVIESAKSLGGKVVLSGHSLGGSVVTAYATWDFAGSPGANGLAGLVYDDGGSGPTPITKEQAEERLEKLNKGGTPWLAFGGIGAPYLGLFSTLGAMGTVQGPNEASLAESFQLLPSNLKPKNEKGELIPVTNEAEFGFGVNVGTSPPNLIAAQVHAGAGISEAANEEGLHTWNGEGAISPLRRYADMLAGTGLRKADGDEWYFPERLTIDTGAVAAGNDNPAQEVLGEHAIHGHELPTSLKILAIGTELGKSNVTKAAEILAEQSGIPAENLTLINKETEYAHNDPAAAEPGGNIEGNAFYSALVPYLEGIAGS
jgi:pimeloyl-ACP methyl ester carboxylesterase